MDEKKPLEVQHFEKPLEIPSFMNRKQHEEEAVREIFSNTDIMLICGLTAAILMIVALQLGVLSL